MPKKKCKIKEYYNIMKTPHIKDGLEEKNQWLW